MIRREKEVVPKVLSDSVERRILCYNDDLMVCSFNLKKGGVIALHEHMHLQTTYIIQGKVRFIVSGETYILESGDNILMDRNAPHMVEVLEDSKIIDIFTPMRQDFID